MLKIIMKIYIMFYIHNYFFNCCTLYVFKIHYMMYWLLSVTQITVRYFS